MFIYCQFCPPPGCRRPDPEAYAFLADGETVEGEVTYGELAVEPVV